MHLFLRKFPVAKDNNFPFALKYHSGKFTYSEEKFTVISKNLFCCRGKITDGVRKLRMEWRNVWRP